MAPAHSYSGNVFATPTPVSNGMLLENGKVSGL